MWREAHRRLCLTQPSQAGLGFYTHNDVGPRATSPQLPSFWIFLVFIQFSHSGHRFPLHSEVPLSAALKNFARRISIVHSSAHRGLGCSFIGFPQSVSKHTSASIHLPKYFLLSSHLFPPYLCVYIFALKSLFYSLSGLEEGSEKKCTHSTHILTQQSSRALHQFKSIGVFFFFALFCLNLSISFGFIYNLRAINTKNVCLVLMFVYVSVTKNNLSQCLKYVKDIFF